MSIPIPALIEAILFACDEPVNLDTLTRVLDLGELEVLSAVADLTRQYKQRGIMLERVAEGFLIRTRPECSVIVRDALSKRGPVELSKGAAETLAVIAYNQPVTRQDIEAVRGVNPESSIETLLEKGLIKEAGRKKSLGRPKLYATTQEFLKKTSLNSLDNLPSLTPKEKSPKEQPGKQQLPLK